jgi:hypothetical protein
MTRYIPRVQHEAVSTTGTSIDAYLSWLREKLDTVEWGEVSITFCINNGFVNHVKKGVSETEVRSKNT